MKCRSRLVLVCPANNVSMNNRSMKRTQHKQEEWSRPNKWEDTICNTTPFAVRTTFLVDQITIKQRHMHIGRVFHGETTN